MKGTIVGVSVLAVVGVFIALVVSSGTDVPDGPMPIAWDREPCAHCRMQIGEPRHAVQLITAEGRVFDFDDVGCAISFLRANKPKVHRLWFHGEGESWIAGDAVGFVRTEVTPMGSGLLAVDRRTADARSLDDVMRDYRAPIAPEGPR